MDRLDAMRAFVAVADKGGFAPAARQLGLSAPSVTRAVAGLEERIGTRLLRRSTRTVRLTEAGAGYLADCKRILAELADAEAAAAGGHTQPTGQLGVTAPVLFGRFHVAPIVLDFLGRHPSVHVRCLLVDRVVDMLEEGFDVAIRIAQLPDSALTAVRVGSVRRVTCAAPRYLERHGVPRRPEDLARHDRVSFSPMFAERDLPNAPPPRLVANTADQAIAAAVAGLGLVRVLAYQVEAELKHDRLRIVLANHEPPPLPIHVVHAEGRRANAKVRAFVDMAVERLRAVRALREAE
ncbi:MAG: LysR family transcriptional regulator [Alphaproteobacteria bacterium]